jgi:hypothetical protein
MRSGFGRFPRLRVGLVSQGYDQGLKRLCLAPPARERFPLYHPDSTYNIGPRFIACSEASPACGFAWHIGVVGTDERLAVGGDGLDGRHVLAALDDVAVLLESRDSICVDLAVDDEDVG